LSLMSAAGVCSSWQLPESAIFHFYPHLSIVCFC